MNRLKRTFLKIILPWVITAVALYYAFHDVEWPALWGHLKSAHLGYIALAVSLTAFSYVLRALRWPLLFPNSRLRFSSSYRLIVLGFFMNNILPARAGEFVRAHLGGKVTGEPRTLVLATVASERLADGLTISLMFAGLIVFFRDGQVTSPYAQSLTYVAYLFVFAALGVLAVLTARNPIFTLADLLAKRFNNKAASYALSRVRIFIDGLAPLCSLKRAPFIIFWSVLIWGVELGVFASVTYALHSPLPLSGAVLFMVAANFSSLVPAAPGGFGVIELFAKQILLSIGVASEELALSMALTQHLVQYTVIGLPGAFLLSNLKSQLKDMQSEVAEKDVAVGSQQAA